MEMQIVLDFLLVSISAILGWLGRELWSAVKELKRDLTELRSEMTHQYVRREDFTEFRKEIVSMLHRIEDKLDKKSDKRNTD